ncbi:MAG: FtsX-like permease family protein [Planctomycetota bacterium]|nr:FtsX-like permease family protein [Planctomycetota bacterium]
MYRLLLCTRYLRTRFIALASIISVMLGVATMIVVNSVMTGFSHEMRTRINGILADVDIETNSLNGEADAQELMHRARAVTSDRIEAISATVEVFGLLHFRRGGQWIPRPVTLVGIDPAAESAVSPLVSHLDSYHDIVENGMVIRKRLRPDGAIPSWDLTAEALAYRLAYKERQRIFYQPATASPFEEAPAEQLMPDDPVFDGGLRQGVPQFDDVSEEPRALDSLATDTAIPVGSRGPVAGPVILSEPDPVTSTTGNSSSKIIQTAATEEVHAGGTERSAEDPFANLIVPDELTQTPAAKGAAEADIDAPLPGRIFIGSGLMEILREDPRTGGVQLERMVHPGDDVKISTVSAGSPPEPRHFFATVVDVYKSGMSEYDSNLVFCNLEYLQEMRGMIDPQSGKGAVTTLKIRLKDYNDAPDVVRKLQNAFPPHLFTVRTWEQKQGPLLAAVDIEAAILNVLLFLIIAVAGFGILAIFYMIVVEKTRDIGILKALGASSRGIMTIFLSYGLALGLVGSGVGAVLGLLFVRYINEIESLLAFIIGRKVFDERIYYFPSIPTQVNAFMVVAVAIGAIVIAVLASVLPARRAAALHPVQALRYE